MNLKEFDKNYYLHDSSVLNIVFDKDQKTLTLYLDFCAWMQNNYREGDPEIVPLTVAFYGIDNYEGPKGESETLGVLHQEIKDDKLYLILTDEINDLSYDIYLKPDSIKIIK